MTTKKIAISGRRERVTIERAYDGVSLADVWEMWTTKDGIEAWWGPDGFAVTVRSIASLSEPRRSPVSVRISSRLARVAASIERVVAAASRLGGGSSPGLSLISRICGTSQIPFNFSKSPCTTSTFWMANHDQTC